MFSRPLVAIDIGSSAIKVVELTGHRQKKLSAIGLELLPAGAVVDGMIQKQEVVEEVLASLLRKLKIRTAGRRAALALNGSSVLVKKVNVAAKNADLAEQVFYEAEQQFQADMSDIYFDYCELGPVGDGIAVLLVGAKREMVEQHIAVVRAIGMRTGVVECGVFSVANMFEYNYGLSDGVTALINVGAHVTQISLVVQGQYVYTRDIPIGGEEYTRRIGELLNIDRAGAETLKVAAGQSDANIPEEMHRILGEINEQLVADVQVTIDYFFQSGEGVRGGLSGVFLAGGGSRVLGLDAALAAALQIPVQISNPFQRIDVNPKRFQMDYILMQGHLYGVAVGLGLRAMADKN